MENNLTILVGLPNVGKTMIAKGVENRIDTVVVNENDAFIEILNELMDTWPDFKDYAEFSKWRSENREETMFLYENKNENNMDNLYQKAINAIVATAKENPEKKYILDMGGYAYTRDLVGENVVYMKYKNVEDFYESFKHEYNDGNGNLKAEFVPNIKGKRTEINENNYKNFYEVSDNQFDKMSRFSLIVEEVSLEDTAERLIYFMEENHNKMLTELNKSKRKLKKGDMVKYVGKDTYQILSDPKEGKFVSIINVRTSKAELVNLESLTHVEDIVKKYDSSVQPGRFD